MKKIGLLALLALTFAACTPEENELYAPIEGSHHWIGVDSGRSYAIGHGYSNFTINIDSVMAVDVHDTVLVFMGHDFIFTEVKADGAHVFTELQNEHNDLGLMYHQSANIFFYPTDNSLRYELHYHPTTTGVWRDKVMVVKK